MLVAFLWAGASMLVVETFKEPIMKFYNPKPAMVSAMKQAWLVLIIFVFFDCMQAVANSNI